MFEVELTAIDLLLNFAGRFLTDDRPQRITGHDGQPCIPRGWLLARLQDDARHLSLDECIVSCGLVQRHVNEYAWRLRPRQPGLECVAQLVKAAGVSSHLTCRELKRSRELRIVAVAVVPDHDPMIVYLFGD